MEESGKKKGVRKWSQESTIVREEPGRKAQERRVSTESARHGGRICAPSNGNAPATSKSRLTCLSDFLCGLGPLYLEYQDSIGWMSPTPPPPRPLLSPNLI